MANCAWSEKILQLLRRMNNFYLPGSCRANCFRFEIDGAHVGWIPPRVASMLSRYPEVFGPAHGGAVSLCKSLDSYEKRSEAVDSVLQALRQDDSLTCLKGWRDEIFSMALNALEAETKCSASVSKGAPNKVTDLAGKVKYIQGPRKVADLVDACETGISSVLADGLHPSWDEGIGRAWPGSVAAIDFERCSSSASSASHFIVEDAGPFFFTTVIQFIEGMKYSVMPKFSDPPLMWMERAATSLFGVKRYGVHINGYTVSDTGEVSMWLARRSRTKQTYPGLLDNVAAGGLAAGVGIKHTLVKECQEEACIPAAIAEKAYPVATVSYTYEDEEGVFPESQFVFDLELPIEFKPQVGDGEVQDFYLLPLDKVKELLATEDFKPSSAMVVLDFLIRHSFIEPDTEPCYQEYVVGLHQRL